MIVIVKQQSQAIAIVPIIAQPYTARMYVYIRVQECLKEFNLSIKDMHDMEDL